MSYTVIKELPTEVQKSFDANDQQVWMMNYNQAVEAGLDTFAQKEQAWMQCRFLDSSRYVCANVSTQVVDTEGDLADVSQYVQVGQKLVEEGGIFTKNHSNKVIGTVWKVEEGIDAQTGLPCVVAYINYFRGTMLYDQSWKEFKSGRTEFSIGSFTKKPERECDFKGCYFRLIPEQWFELSNVDRGINPITYPVEFNDSVKGMEEMTEVDDGVPRGNVIELHDDICPAKQKYLRFKDNMKSYGHDTYYDEDFLLIHGLLGEDEMVYMYKEYPDIREFEILRGEGEEDDYTLILPRPINNSDEMLHDMIHLMMDEQEAIQGYNTVTKSLMQGTELENDDVEKINNIFSEIIRDEEKHIGGILEAIRIINPDMYSQIADGMKESSEEAEKGECPAGQHQHAGVWGCHDIFRRHHADDKTLPTDKLDLTDENIDVNAIQDTPTENLQVIVRKVASVLTRYSDEQVQQFLSTTPGKEFVLAFLELKRRKMNGENNMTEKEAGCSKTEEIKAESADVEPVQEAEKGAIPDIQSSIANISSTLASITAVIDQMNIRLMKLEDSDLMGQNEDQGTSITDAIMSEATGEGSATEIPPAQDAEEDGGDKGEVPPQFEKTDDEAEEDSDDETEEKVEEKTETETEVKEEDDSKDDESKDDDKSEDEDSDKKEDESKDEEKSEEKSDESESKEEDKKEEDKEEKKDEEEEKKKGEEIAEPSAPEAEEPEAPKGEGEAEPKSEEAEKSEPVQVEEVSEEAEPTAKAVEPQLPPEQPVEEMQLPIPKGGQAVDFRAMLLRKEELKAKGVEVYVAEDGAQKSFANIPVEAVKGTNVSLIRPSGNISAFDAESGLTPRSNSNVWKNMGSTTNSTNFLKKLIGE